MKILFLDIDGVLKTPTSEIYWQTTKNKPPEDVPFYYLLCPIACSNLQHLLKSDKDLKIVISSTWRVGNKLSKIRWILDEFGVDSTRVISHTPVNLDDRGDQIMQWIDKSEDEIIRFVVVDDMLEGMDKVKDNLITTDYEDGLTLSKVIEISKRFNSSYGGWGWNL